MLDPSLQGLFASKGIGPGSSLHYIVSYTLFRTSASTVEFYMLE